MKKALALILTAAMLIGSFTISSFAVREVTEDTSGITTSKGWTWDEDNAYMQSAEYGTSNITMQFDVSSAVADKGSFTDYGFNSPTIDIINDKIGVGAAQVSYDFAPQTWYNVKYVCNGTSTEIFVDGASVGTVSAAFKSMWCGGAFLISIDNYKITNNETGAVITDETFEDDTFDFITDGNGAIFSYQKGEKVIHNDNVSYKDNKYWTWDEDNAYMQSAEYGTSNITMQFDVSSAVADKGSFTDYGFNSPTIDIINDKIGVGAAQVSYDFAPQTWYNVKYVCNGTSTEIFVDGASVGTVSAAFKSMWCGGAFLISIDNYKITNNETGAVITDETFEDGTFDFITDGNGAIATNKIELSRSDLGLKYWTWDEDNAYMQSAEYGTANITMQFDVSSAVADKGSFTDYGYNSPTIDIINDKIGVGAAQVSYDFAPQTWYNVKYVCNGTATEIFVDGASVGTVSAAFKSMWCGGAFLISIDNYKITNNETGAVITDETFEDGTFDFKDGGNGAAVDYVFATEPEPPKPFPLPLTTAEGSAILLESEVADNSLLIDHSSTFTPNGNNAIFSFDLAIVPNDKGTGNDSYLEFWSNVAYRRFKIGTTFTGRDDDLTAFNWGDATATNFHHVVIWYQNDKASIYMDPTDDNWNLVYNGNSGDIFLNGTMTLFNAVKCSVIMDNFNIYNPTDLSVLQTISAGNIGSNAAGLKDPKDIQIGAACATNGHIYGHTTTTTAPTCYSLGEDTMYCAVCGEAYKTADVAMVDHVWNKYDLNRKTEDGLCYINCTNAGCVEKRYTTLPTADSYTGKYYVYMDMQDDMINILDGNFGCNFNYIDGKAVLTADSYEANYTSFDIDAYMYNAIDKVPVINFSTSFDMTYQGTFNDDATNKPDGSLNYGHIIYWYYGGVDEITIAAGYNSDTQKLFIMGGPDKHKGQFLKEIDYALIPGETYNFGVNYIVNDTDQLLDTSLLVNGKAVITFNDDDDDAYGSLRYNMSKTDLTTMLFRNFGTLMDVDNVVVGSADFAWNRTYDGDLDGDYTLTVNDALLMRKFLAKVIDESAIASSRADANADGRVNAVDQLVIRQTLAA